MSADAQALTCDLNAAVSPSAYLEALNQCFPGWGNAEQYAWAFEREVGGPRADVMVLRDGAECLAGSAVSYRRVALGDGREALAGIMTGSWTLPAARGKGCFTRIIDESLSLVRQKGGLVLLAFVTHDNASARRLLVAGAGTFASSYIVSEPGGAILPSDAPAAELRRWDDKLLAAVVDRRAAQGANRSRLLYDPAQWRGQFVDRSPDTYLLRLGDLGWAAMETRGNFERLLGTALEPGASAREVLASLVAFAAGRKRQLFVFSLDPKIDEAARDLGMTLKPGFMTALSAEPTLQDSRLLAEPSSEHYLGPWFLEGGDRM